MSMEVSDEDGDEYREIKAIRTRYSYSSLITHHSLLITHYSSLKKKSRQFKPAARNLPKLFEILSAYKLWRPFLNKGCDAFAEIFC